MLATTVGPRSRWPSVRRLKPQSLLRAMPSMTSPCPWQLFLSRAQVTNSQILTDLRQAIIGG